MKTDRIMIGITGMDSFHWPLSILNYISEHADVFTRSRTMTRNGFRTSRNGGENTQLK